MTQLHSRFPSRIDGAETLRWEDPDTWHAFDDLFNAAGAAPSDTWSDISRTRSRGYFVRILDTADTLVSNQEGAEPASLYFGQVAVGRTLRSARGTVIGEVPTGPAVALDCLRPDGGPSSQPVNVCMGRSALDHLLVVTDCEAFLRGREAFDPQAYLDLFARLAADSAHS